MKSEEKLKRIEQKFNETNDELEKSSDDELEKVAGGVYKYYEQKEFGIENIDIHEQA